jgi:hypothetical protein
MILVIGTMKSKSRKEFSLTLSGYSRHAGIEIPGYFRSLAQYAYAQWAGLYENLGRYVYVNRGFDFTPTQVE